jgi:hypothetical protein
VKLRKIWLSILAIVSALVLPDRAQAGYCPGKIAIIEGSRLSTESLPILKQVYMKLKCAPEIVSLPGRRGVVHFNRSLIDGEQFRIEIIESQYDKPFVRSAVPMFSITGAIWAHPEPATSQGRPLAYVLGFAWQENYVSAGNFAPAAVAVKFKSDVEAIEAYNRRVVGSFMSTSQTMKIHNQKGRMIPKPVLHKVVSKTSVYHYLDPKYAKFMADFSEVLRRQDPFARLN